MTMPLAYCRCAVCGVGGPGDGRGGDAGGRAAAQPRRLARSDRERGGREDAAPRGPAHNRTHRHSRPAGRRPHPAGGADVSALPRGDPALVRRDRARRNARFAGDRLSRPGADPADGRPLGHQDPALHELRALRPLAQRHGLRDPGVDGAQHHVRQVRPDAADRARQFRRRRAAREVRAQFHELRLRRSAWS